MSTASSQGLDSEASTPSPHCQAPSPSDEVPPSSEGEGTVGRLAVTPDDSSHQLKLEALTNLAADKPPHVYEKHTRLPVSFTCRHAKRSIELMHCQHRSDMVISGRLFNRRSWHLFRTSRQPLITALTSGASRGTGKIYAFRSGRDPSGMPCLILSLVSRNTLMSA
jgi:hypothetical protein